MSASPASISYATSGIPVGVALSLTFYRGANSSGTITIPATPLSGSPPGGAAGAGGCLGTYICNVLGFKPGTKIVERTDAVGADLDWALVRSGAEVSATVQRASAATPVLMPGDCCEIVLGKDGDASTNLPYARFVITSPGLDESSGDVAKQSVTMRLDRQNSSASLVQF